jgi:hypothetical protein
VKLISVSSTEMCDERTASRMGALSTAKRNGLSAEHIIQSVQLQEFWGTNGFEPDPSGHQVHLKLPKRATPSVVTLPTPKLSDLLNPLLPEIDSDTTLFDNPDPYELDKVSDPLEDPEMPQIIRGGKTLDIEQYVDLRNLKLQRRYKPLDHDNDISEPEAPKPVKKVTPWVEGSYNPDKFDLDVD